MAIRKIFADLMDYPTLEECAQMGNYDGFEGERRLEELEAAQARREDAAFNPVGIKEKSLELADQIWKASDPDAI